MRVLVATLLLIPSTLLPWSASTGVELLDTGRVERIAAHLENDPVFVSDHFVVSGSMVAQLQEVVDGAGFDVYVAVVPAVPGAVNGHDLAVAIHDWMGRAGVYVVAHRADGEIAAASFGVDVPAGDAARAVTADVPVEAGVVFRVDTLVDVLSSGRSRIGWWRELSGVLPVVAGIGTFGLVIAGRLAWASRGRRRRW